MCLNKTRSSRYIIYVCNKSLQLFSLSVCVKCMQYICICNKFLKWEPVSCTVYILDGEVLCDTHIVDCSKIFGTCLDTNFAETKSEKERPKTDLYHELGHLKSESGQFKSHDP